MCLELTWVGDDVCEVGRGWGVLHGHWLLRHSGQLPEALVIRALEVPDDSHAALCRLLSMTSHKGVLLLLLHPRARHQACRLDETHVCLQV
jgi:hypothetical protein